MLILRVKVLKILLGLFYFLSGGFLLIIVHVQDVKSSPTSTGDPSPSPSPFKGKKEFIYLVQAESCLPKHLLDTCRFGTGSNRDVIVLSWKAKCTDHNSGIDFPHVQYIFRTNTSWGSGRNILYRLVLLRRKDYLYYIFLDEDLEFSFTDGVTHEDVYNTSVNSPLLAFENFLRGHEPAVGLANFCSICGKYIPDKSAYVAAKCCSPKPSSSIFPPIFPVSISFDAGFNAFHRDAIKYLLPYNLEYEKVSWWESQKYVILAADLFFRGQVLRYNPVTVINTKHREYPKAAFQNWKHILSKLRALLPERLRTLSVFHDEPIPNMDFNISGNVLFTPRWNITIPKPKTPIIPLRHFQIL